ncbi:MAG: DUF928 domain-containing protein [Hormoscilla sp.]
MEIVKGTIGIITTIAIATTMSAGLARGVTFTPSKNAPAPQQGQAASSRSGQVCGSTQAAVKAAVRVLLPRENYGTTVSAHPEILVYVPETSAREALFALKTSDKRMVQRMTVPLSGKAEIITIKLPETAPALEVGETYKWYFGVKCAGSLRPNDPAEGWIKRIEPSEALLPAQSTGNLLEAAKAYGSAGIWYDTLASMSELRKNEPSDREIARHWEELLGSVGLNDMVNVSFGN